MTDMEHTILPTNSNNFERLEFLFTTGFTQSCDNPLGVDSKLFNPLTHFACSYFVSDYQDLLEVPAVYGEAFFEVLDLAFEFGGLEEAD
jgi:hypothetical protein